MDLGWTYYFLENFEEMLRIFKVGLGLGQDASAFLEGCGYALYALGKNEDALALYRNSLQLNSKSDSLHNNMTELFFRQKNFNDALKHILFAIQINSNSASHQNMLANIFFAGNKYSESLGCFKIAKTLSKVSQYEGYTISKKLNPKYLLPEEGEEQATIKLNLEKKPIHVHDQPENKLVVQKIRQDIDFVFKPDPYYFVAPDAKKSKTESVTLIVESDLSAPLTKDLIAAVINNQPAIVKKLLSQGANVNAMVDKDENLGSMRFPAPLLVYAIETKKLEIVELLLQSGANVNKTSISGYFPLAAAAFKGLHNLVIQLIKLGANIHQKHQEDTTVVMYAAESGNLELVKYLLGLGCGLHQKDARGVTSISYAILSGNLELVSYLHQAGDDIFQVSLSGFSLLYHAAANGQMEILKYLHNAGVDANSDANKDTCTPLYIACQNGHLPIVKYLVNEAKAEVDKVERTYGYSPLLAASSKGHLDIVQFLLSMQANVNHKDYRGYTPLMAASSGGHLNVVQVLLGAKADVNLFTTYEEKTAEKNQWRAIHFAVECRADSYKVVDLLLKTGANINVQTARGDTPLCLAARYDRHLCAARLLEEKNINPNLRSKDTRWMTSPLNWAAKLGHINVLMSLLNHPRIDINLMDFSDWPLNSAVYENRIEVVKILLADERLDKTIHTHDGTSLLEIAKNKGFREIELLLSQNGFKIQDKHPLIAAVREGNLKKLKKLVHSTENDMNVTTDNGETALYIACLYNNIEAVRILLTSDDLDINQANNSGNFPLYIAAEKGYAEIVALLIEDPRIQLNKKYASDGSTSFFHAAYHNHIEVVKTLLSAGNVDVNECKHHKGNDGYAPLSIVTKRGFYEMTKLLLSDPKINVNVRTAEWTGSNTPLILAANKNNRDKEGLEQQNHVKVLSALLDHPKTDINAVNAQQNTAVCYAASCCVDCLDLFLKKKADINRANERGYTPLMLAVDSENEQTILSLLKVQGIQIDSTNEDGASALILAAQQGSLNIVKILIIHGANPFIKSLNGLTARLEAIQNGHILVAEFLKNVEDHYLQKNVIEKQKELKQIIEIKESEQQVVRQKYDLSQTQQLPLPDDQIKVIQQQLKVLQTQHEKLYTQYQAQQQRIEADQYLTKEPLLKAFHYHLQSKLTELFLAYKVLGSGEVKSNFDQKSSSKLAQGIRLLGEIIPLPGASIIGKAIAGGINYVAEKEYKRTIKLISALLRNLSVLDKTAQAVGRLLSFQYEEQILSLKDENQAQVLAECAVGRIMGMLAKDLIDDDSSISEQIANVITEFQSKEGLLKLTHRKLITQKPKVIWTDQGIFQKTGIELTDGRCFSGADCESNLYGFRLGTDSQVKSKKFLLQVSNRPKHLLLNNPFRHREDFISEVAATTSTSFAVTPIANHQVGFVTQVGLFSASISKSVPLIASGSALSTTTNNQLAVTVDAKNGAGSSASESKPSELAMALELERERQKTKQLELQLAQKQKDILEFQQKDNTQQSKSTTSCCSIQ